MGNRRQAISDADRRGRLLRHVRLDRDAARAACRDLERDLDQWPHAE